MRSRLIVVSSVLIAAWIAACGSDGRSVAPGDSGDAGNDGTTTPTSDAAGDGSSATDAPIEGSVGPATDASDFPRWSSIVTRISGTIAAGEKLALEVPAAQGRTFQPKVTELETARRNFLALVSDVRPELRASWSRAIPRWCALHWPRSSSCPSRSVAP